MILPWLLGCDAEGPPAGPTLLPVEARAARISMSLRGVRPTDEERLLVRAGPAALDGLIEEWLVDPRFGAMVRDLHAEVYALRNDGDAPWPAIDELEGETAGAMYESTREAPLYLVERVVTEGRPYTEVVTAPWTWADRRMALIDDLDYDPEGPLWQETHYRDGRPEAGVLSSSALWQRWWTNGSGKHRNRANFLTKAFLCAEIGVTDIPISPDLDLDLFASASALTDEPTCVACHQTLDPLASQLWGFDLARFPSAVDGYPLGYWTGNVDGWESHGMSPPGFYGEPTGDLADLGRAIADDPRFTRCAVTQAWRFLAQDPGGEVPPALLASATAAFAASGHDWRVMVGHLVRSDAFLADDGRRLQVRPEALARMLEDLGGGRWTLDDPAWGPVDVLSLSELGARDLAGGTDHESIAHPSFTPNPGTWLAWDAAVRHAADRVIADGGLDTTLDDDAAIRAQLATWIARAATVEVAHDDPWVDELVALYGLARAARPPEEAWALVLRALLLDPRAVTY